MHERFDELKTRLAEIHDLAGPWRCSSGTRP